jgi:hypothetical protein
MTVELFSEGTRRVCRLSATAFGRLLHLARLNGWCPDTSPQDWAGGDWDTQILLPHLGPYVPGPVSAAEARSLTRALVKAAATGQTALDGSLHLASEALLHVARLGAFRVRCRTATPLVHVA